MVSQWQGIYIGPCTYMSENEDCGVAMAWPGKIMKSKCAKQGIWPLAELQERAGGGSADLSTSQDLIAN